MSEGVEWALHSCLNLAWIGPERAVTAARLAAYHDLPAAYLNKQLQALARAGIVTSVSGPKGGFRLARGLDRITLMDVYTAIEGPEEAFRCTEIRRQGPGAGPPRAYAAECAIAGAMGRAELAWRRELAAQTLDDVRRRAELQAPTAPDRLRSWFAGT
ncbi:Rrf2 family transcriptional regulator [Streptomyces sp. SP18ES09]|uniref:RrF2 family transcriptional regulator n=1 Tax=Streptomyces sp. SP18ES09 TaxID=3002532 RepID=UPI002E7732B3|nr:Rrf2 family transcriptional regulator [Streptomyces sp. SP18ES09]MEE1817887.1 Rrf2 family transcriptional regulator [Streptomyces sp. SP18ES09]